MKKRPGALFVFEGPDGVGKTSLVDSTKACLEEAGHVNVGTYAFPGREGGTLGRHVYDLHHEPGKFGISSLSPVSLQLLHIAAHLDAIDRVIRPRIERGEIVLLDRYWWSTWVYGISSGAKAETLDAMIAVERKHWGDLLPTAVFLVARSRSLRMEESAAAFSQRASLYDVLARRESERVRIIKVVNDDLLDDAARFVAEAIDRELARSER